MSNQSDVGALREALEEIAELQDHTRVGDGMNRIERIARTALAIVDIQGIIDSTPEGPVGEMAEALRTQHGRSTAHPYFLVQEKVRDHGYDSEYADNWTWHDPSDPEAIHGNGEQPSEEAFKVYYNVRWEFVQAFLTDKAARAYIEENGHRHRNELRTYGESAHRNPEIQWLRAHFMASTPEGEPVGEPPDLVERLRGLVCKAEDCVFYCKTSCDIEREAADRIEELERENAELLEVVAERRREVAKWRDGALRSQSDVEALREALEPFARFAEMWETNGIQGAGKHKPWCKKQQEILSAMGMFYELREPCICERRVGERRVLDPLDAIECGLYTFDLRKALFASDRRTEGGDET